MDKPAEPGIVLPIEQLDEIRMSDITNFTTHFEDYINAKSTNDTNAKTAAKEALLLIERNWNSIYIVYQDPSTQAAEAIGSNVGANLGIHIARTRRLQLLQPLAAYFIKMACDARDILLGASEQEKYEMRARGPSSWLHWQHMRVRYARAALGEVMNVARKKARFLQGVRQRGEVEREVERERAKVVSGKSVLGKREYFRFDEFVGEGGEAFMGARGLGDAVTESAHKVRVVGGGGKVVDASSPRFGHTRGCELDGSANGKGSGSKVGSNEQSGLEATPNLHQPSPANTGSGSSVGFAVTPGGQAMVVPAGIGNGRGSAANAQGTLFAYLERWVQKADKYQ